MLKLSRNYYIVSKFHSSAKENTVVESFTLSLKDYNSTVLHLINEGYSVKSDDNEKLILSKNNITYKFDFISEWEED